MKGMTNSIAPGAASIPRSALANDALYSPVRQISDNITLAQSDLGRTIFPAWKSTSTTYTVTLDATTSGSLPTGFEVAFARLWPYATMHLAFSDIRLLYNGEQIVYKGASKTVELERGAMVALKKLISESANGDVWILTGNVEVVS